MLIQKNQKSTIIMLHFSVYIAMQPERSKVARADTK